MSGMKNKISMESLRKAKDKGTLLQDTVITVGRMGTEQQITRVARVKERETLSAAIVAPKVIDGQNARERNKGAKGIGTGLYSL